MIVGVLGGGQLARMLALAGHPLGLRFLFLDPAADACAGVLGGRLLGAYDDPGCLDELARGSDLVTYEFENVPAASVERLAAGAPVYPSPRALAVGQNRLTEKTLFRDLGIPTADFVPVDGPEDLASAVARVGLPAVLKTRTQGYDGKGQAVLREAADLDGAWGRIGAAPAILESFVSFERELSVIAVRGRNGETACYPLSENSHRAGILRLSVSRAGDPLETLARDYVGRLLDALNYVGVLALELFQAGDGLLANEFAPRVHNSGHWTIEGAETSQFENHLRAVLGLPLGSTAPVGTAAMINFIGDLPDPAAVLAIPGAHLHAYGKAPREGRKVGHATIRAFDPERLREGIERLSALADQIP